MPKANKRVAIRWDSVEKHGMAKTKAVFAAAANNPNGPKKTTTKKKQGAVLPESEPAPKKEPTPLTYAEQEALSLQVSVVENSQETVPSLSQRKNWTIWRQSTTMKHRVLDPQPSTIGAHCAESVNVDLYSIPVVMILVEFCRLMDLTD